MSATLRHSRPFTLGPGVVVVVVSLGADVVVGALCVVALPDPIGAVAFPPHPATQSERASTPRVIFTILRGTKTRLLSIEAPPRTSSHTPQPEPAALRLGETSQADPRIDCSIISTNLRLSSLGLLFLITFLSAHERVTKQLEPAKPPRRLSDNLRATLGRDTQRQRVRNLARDDLCSPIDLKPRGLVVEAAVEDGAARTGTRERRY